MTPSYNPETGKATLVFSEEPVNHSRSVSAGVMAHYDENGHIVLMELECAQEHFQAGVLASIKNV